LPAQKPGAKFGIAIAADAKPALGLTSERLHGVYHLTAVLPQKVNHLLVQRAQITFAVLTKKTVPAIGKGYYPYSRLGRRSIGLTVINSAHGIFSLENSITYQSSVVGEQ
jgi:hypothetical protein